MAWGYAMANKTTSSFSFGHHFFFGELVNRKIMDSEDILVVKKQFSNHFGDHERVKALIERTSYENMPIRKGNRMQL